MVEEQAAVPVYLFHGFHPGAPDDTVVCAAPIDTVVAVFGDGGTYDMGGLAAAFGGCAYFHNDWTGAAWLAVWGVKKASRFRAILRQNGVRLDVRETRPSASLMARVTT